MGRLVGCGPTDGTRWRGALTPIRQRGNGATRRGVHWTGPFAAPTLRRPYSHLRYHAGNSVSVRRMGRLIACAQLELNRVGVEARQPKNMSNAAGESARFLRRPFMTKDQAIHRIQIAVSELREYAVIQGTVGRTSANEAITALEELREAIQKRQLDQRHRSSLDSSHMPPPYRWG